MRFKTGFVVGCATGLYLTRKIRQLQGPLAGRGTLSGPSSQWLRQSGPSLLTGDLKADKVLAVGDLARQRARDVLRGPVGNLARERVMNLFEDAIASQRSESARRA